MLHQKEQNYSPMKKKQNDNSNKKKYSKIGVKILRKRARSMYQWVGYSKDLYHHCG